MRLNSNDWVKIPNARFQQREPAEGEICEMVKAKMDHGPHWVPLGSRRGSQLCMGWHAMVREITTVRARFHARYVRGMGSDMIHRSAHVGEVTWFPLDFHHEGPCRPAIYRVEIVCMNFRLRTPELLDFTLATKAFYNNESRKPGGKVILCPKCFPTPKEESK